MQVIIKTKPELTPEEEQLLTRLKKILKEEEFVKLDLQTEETEKAYTEEEIIKLMVGTKGRRLVIGLHQRPGQSLWINKREFRKREDGLYEEVQKKQYKMK